MDASLTSPTIAFRSEVAVLSAATRVVRHSPSLFAYSSRGTARGGVTMDRRRTTRHRGAPHRRGQDARYNSTATVPDSHC